MADIVIGQKARNLFGQSESYLPGMAEGYKPYIDTLQQAMLAATYSGDITQCVITQTLNMINIIDDSSKYVDLEMPVIYFCQVHDVQLNIQRSDSSINITVNLLINYSLIYS